MKKILAIFFIMIMLPVSASTDKYSKEYLQSKKHIAIINPFAEFAVEQGIKKALKKETKGKYDVKFTAYNLSSLKKGIFKSFEITGTELKSNDLTIPYVHLTSLSDYNYIDYKSDPVVFKSDMEFRYDIDITEETINSALNDRQYQSTIKMVNKLAYPLFEAKAIRTKISNNKLYILMDYNLPIAKFQKERTFVTSCDFEVVNGKIKAKNVKLDSVYGKISINKVANLINLLNPLQFTLDLLESKKCEGKIENINIVDNIVKVNGKIFVKGDDK